MLSLDQQNSYRERFRRMRPGWRPATEVYADLVRRRLKEDSRVLDLGGGRGGLIEQLDFPLTQVVNLDPDWRSLVEHRLSKLPRVTGFSHPLPFANGVFDVIFCSWLLEHLPDPTADLAEISRVLRPGGSFIFITPNKKHPLAWVNRVLGGVSAVQDRLVERLYGRAAADAFPTFYRANTVETITQLATTHHLTPITLHLIPDPTYMAFHPALFRLMAWLDPRLPQNWWIHLVGEVRREKRE
ncbi:MAG: methyltransferase domain-containing protein [Ardenticatenaceae bacterium]|nr:methyltransferase domain-containing protein [Ardenticatenaceae bacterium]